MAHLKDCTMTLSNYSATTGYIVCDLELFDDENLYAAYTRVDHRPARCRAPMRRIVAASLMALKVENGILDVENFTSLSGPDEDLLTHQILEYIRARPHCRVVTYGGLNADVPALQYAAMEHGLKLPRQLWKGERDRRGHLHLDLAVELKTNGEYCHLLEVATRLALPAKFGLSAMAIPHMVAQGDYLRIEQTAEVDTISTSLVLASWLATRGELISADAAHYSILRHVRLARGRAPYNSYLGNVMDRIRGRMNRDLQRWMARVA